VIIAIVPDVTMQEFTSTSQEWDAARRLGGVAAKVADEGVDRELAEICRRGEQHCGERLDRKYRLVR